MPEPVLLDLGDFDAVGIAGHIVAAVRSHAILTGLPATATVAPPDGWHTLRITATRSGIVTLRFRAKELSVSRWSNVFRDMADRGTGWGPDDDHAGMSKVFHPGTDPTDVAFEILAALTVSGAPSDVRQVTLQDVDGTSITLE